MAHKGNTNLLLDFSQMGMIRFVVDTTKNIKYEFPLIFRFFQLFYPREFERFRWRSLSCFRSVQGISIPAATARSRPTELQRSPGLSLLVSRAVAGFVVGERRLSVTNASRAVLPALFVLLVLVLILVRWCWWCCVTICSTSLSGLRPGDKRKEGRKEQVSVTANRRLPSIVGFFSSVVSI